MQLKSTTVETIKFINSQEDDLGLEISIQDIITDLKNIKDYHRTQYNVATSKEKQEFQVLVNDFYNAINSIIDNEYEDLNETSLNALLTIKTDTSRLKDTLVQQSTQNTESQNE